MFTWYWLADLCEQEGIDFVLGHALYMKAILAHKLGRAVYFMLKNKVPFDQKKLLGY